MITLSILNSIHVYSKCSQQRVIIADVHQCVNKFSTSCRLFVAKSFPGRVLTFWPDGSLAINFSKIDINFQLCMIVSSVTLATLISL